MYVVMVKLFMYELIDGQVLPIKAMYAVIGPCAVMGLKTLYRTYSFLLLIDHN